MHLTVAVFQRLALARRGFSPYPIWMPCRVTVMPHGEATIIRMAGDFDRGLSQTLADLIVTTAAKVVISLGGVDHINSGGMRDWIGFMRGFVAGRKVVLAECSAEFIGQVNMIPDMAQGAVFRSFNCIWTCDDCSAERTVLVALPLVAPHTMTENCQCGGRFEQSPDSQIFLKLIAAGDLECESDLHQGA